MVGVRKGHKKGAGGPKQDFGGAEKLKKKKRATSGKEGTRKAAPISREQLSYLKKVIGHPASRGKGTGGEKRTYGENAVRAND